MEEVFTKGGGGAAVHADVSVKWAFVSHTSSMQWCDPPPIPPLVEEHPAFI